MSCSDKEFVQYIKRKQDAFEEGATIKPDQLMKNEADKYKTLFQRGSWNAPDTNEEKILALQTELRKLKRKSTSKQGDNTSKKPSKEKPKWFHEKPKTVDLHKGKEWNGKTWWYCHPETGGKCDGKYRLHKPSQCQGKGFRFNKDKGNEPTQKKKKTRKDASGQRSLQLNKALRAAETVAELDGNSSVSTE